MKKFAVAISIGAALSGSFTGAMASGKTKIRGLHADVKALSAQKIAVAEVKNYHSEIASLTAKAARMPKVTTKVRRELTAARENFKSASLRARDMGLKVSDLARAESELNRKLKTTNTTLQARKQLSANKATRQELQGNFMGAAGTAAAVATPIYAAVQFESAMADVKKVVDFESPAAFKAMGNDILELSTKVPLAADGISAIVAAAGQSGIAKSREELLGFANDAAKMGVAFDLEASAAGKMMADWRAGLNINQVQTVALANATNHLSNKMNAEAGAIGLVIQRQGAVAKAAGLSAIETASLSAALLSSGAAPEIASTALKNLTGALTKGSAATKGQSEAFETLGFDAVEMSRAMQEDAPKAIQAVFKALSEAPKEDQSALISELFGDESKGAIAPLLSNMGNLTKAFDLTSDASAYGSSMLDEYKSRSATTANNLALLGNRTTRLAVSTGAVLLPALNAVLQPIGAVMDGAAGIATAFPTTTTVIVGLGVGLAIIPPAMWAVKFATTGVSDAVAYSKIVWAGLNTVVDFGRGRLIAYGVASKATAAATKIMTAGQWLFNAAMTANPIGVAVVAVGALVAGGVALYKNWDTVSAYGLKLWGNMKKIFSFTPLGLLVSGFTRAKNFLTTIDWSASGSAIIGTLTAGIKSAAMAPVNAVSDVLASVREYLPFSDAKKGPLSSLTASGAAIPGTMAKGVASDTSLAGSMEQKLALPKAGGGGGGGGGMTLHFSPTIHAPGGDASQITELLQLSEQRLKKIIQQVMHDQRRGSYA